MGLFDSPPTTSGIVVVSGTNFGFDSLDFPAIARAFPIASHPGEAMPYPLVFGQVVTTSGLFLEPPTTSGIVIVDFFTEPGVALVETPEGPAIIVHGRLFPLQVRTFPVVPSGRTFPLLPQDS